MLYVHISLTLIPKTSSLTAATCTHHYYHDETWCLLLVDSMTECVLSQTVGHINEVKFQALHSHHMTIWLQSV